MYTLSYNVIYFFPEKCLYRFFGRGTDDQLSTYAAVCTNRWGRGDFSVQKLGLFLKLTFTYFVSCWSLNHETVEK